jgi:inner membrane transporter RhtA
MSLSTSGHLVSAGLPEPGHDDRLARPATGAGQRGVAAGAALMTVSAASNQFGAATATLAFPSLGPVGVVAVRQWVAAIVLLTTIRPRFTAFTRAQWRPVIALALIFAAMNVTLYGAIDRVGLGLAVTLEFLGPLSVALLAARRRLDLVCALAAAAGVLILARPRPSADYLGVALGLVAAACWALYIVVGRVVGGRVPGAAGPATAAGVSALLYVPVGAWVLATQPVTALDLGRAAVAGVLCSAIPMAFDLQALRMVTPRFYGVFSSIQPVFAALIGLVVLGQSLGLPDWLAIAVIVSANVACVGRGRPPLAPAAEPAGTFRLAPGGAATDDCPVAEILREQPRSQHCRASDEASHE